MPRFFTGSSIDAGVARLYLSSGGAICARAALSPPVLVITEPKGRYGEILALRLQRLSRLTEIERSAVLSDDADDLIYLDPRLCPGLDEENAAIVTTSMRLPVSALDLARPLGRLGSNEIRAIHERLVRAHRLDLGGMIRDRARELVTTLGE